MIHNHGYEWVHTPFMSAWRPLSLHAGLRA